MNAWKPGPDGGPNLPWMHPEATDRVREALALRYRFLPLLYNLARRAHHGGEPIIAPLFYHFDDPACRAEWDAFMVGRDVLVVPAVAPDARTVEVYLPETAGGWHDFATGELYPGGQIVTLPAPLERLPILVRDGALLPLADEWPANAPHDPTRVLLTLYAGPDFTSGEGRFYWDDGMSVTGAEAMVKVTAQRVDGEVQMALETTGREEILPEIRMQSVTPSMGAGA